MLFSKIIKKKFDAVLGRYDGDPAKYYFSPKDFTDLRTENFNIAGDRNVTLMGAFYYYDHLSPEKLVVFDHGIGAGHMAYMKEINYLARRGYTVYAYDHTGCVATGGTGILGFAQGINDLDHVLTALGWDSRFCKSPIKLVGHSWGAYSALNVAALHPEVTHVVSLAGFLSARSLIDQYLPKFVKKYASEILAREAQINPKYADMDARESLKKTNAHVMHVQSRDDAMVKYSLSFEPLSKALDGRLNTVMLSVDKRNHNPQITDAAAAAVKAMEADLKKEHPKTSEAQDAFRASHDWNLMTHQDPVVWEKILRFLEE